MRTGLWPFIQWYGEGSRYGLESELDAALVLSKQRDFLHLRSGHWRQRGGAKKNINIKGNILLLFILGSIRIVEIIYNKRKNIPHFSLIPI